MPFILEEVTGDLFSSPDSLAHCVSQDLRMGKGIALLFKKKFGNELELKNQNKQIGQVAKLHFSLESRVIYYMITKAKYSGKPTLKTMEDTLVSLRDEMISDGMDKLSIPRIGCGLDLLKWADVKALICKVFADEDIKITVYTL